MATRVRQLQAIEHIVVLMLASRSFDHMLGFLYTDQRNVSPSGHTFDGLTGSESNPDSSGQPVTVFRIEPATPGAYFMPGASPGEGYHATSQQLFGPGTDPAEWPAVPANAGFVTQFGRTLGWQADQRMQIRQGTTARDIMGCFSPEALPVLSGLARGYAVCDRWFCSAPTENVPNRAFACAGTSEGHMDNTSYTVNSSSIFGLLETHGLGWAIYGYDRRPTTTSRFTDIRRAAGSHLGLFADFIAAAADGTLPAFTFLEPSWGPAGNSQHPPYNVALGERLIYDIYQALRGGPGWPQTLLVITYDEHGGCYDHAPPPLGALPPDDSPQQFGFGFTRFGVRVPAVLVSPLIEAGTVFRAPPDGPPLDHTSILKTVQERWGLPALTARDAAAPGFGDVLTLAAPRTDDVLAGISVPEAAADEEPDTPQAATQPAEEVSEAASQAGPDAGRQAPPKAQLTGDSWTVDDKLGYEAYADAIAAFIRHPDTTPPLTIGIKGPWGSGKTSLMRMVEQRLDPPVRGRRQDIPLAAKSREQVSPRRRRPAGTHDEQVTSEPPRVRNREVFNKARQPAGRGAAADAALKIDPPAGAHDAPQGADAWRPTVWFNPWMYQSGEQIWAGFAYEIITQVTRRLPPGDRERFWLRLNLARLDREVVRRRAYRLLLERLVPVALGGVVVAVLALAALVLARLAPQLASSLHRAAAAMFSAGALAVVAGAIVQTIRFGSQSAGVAFGGLVDEPSVLAQGVRKEAAGLLAGTVADPGYQSRTGFLHVVNTDMRRVLDIFATSSRPLVVFVDDLDRCSPGAVVQVIEAINLFLAGEFANCIFVLAMEPDVVAADIEVAYRDQMARLSNRPAAHGWDTLGWRFLEKIVQLPLSLPPAAQQMQTTFVRALLNVPAGHPAADPPATAPPASPAPVGGPVGGTAGVIAPQAAASADGLPASAGAAASQPAAAADQAHEGAPEPPDPALIREIEMRIRRRQPDLDSLERIAREVQASLDIRSQQLDDATVAAVNHVFADLYSDRQAFQAIDSALPDLDSTNPREIKRYINLFRFYTFIAYRKQLAGAPALTGEQIAKLATLAIRWPDLLSFLMMAGEDGRTNLTALSRAAAGTATGPVKPASTKAWLQLLARTGLHTGDGCPASRWDDLRYFLAAAPGIAEVAEHFI